ncbi:MAG: branched-chain amino acid ABC transporter permease [Thermodesulfobacteriota bacterium]
MSFEVFMTNLLYGLTIGSALILIASSLSLIFGVMGVVNFAHGSLAMLGAYLAYTLILLKFNFWLALIVSPLIVGVLGLAIEAFTLRPLYAKNPLLQFFLTYGMAMIIANVVLYAWGGDALGIDKPSSLRGPINILGVYYPKFRSFVFIFSAALAVGLWLFLTKTTWGIILRAGIHNRELVEAFGINMSMVFTLVFALGSALAAVAGVILGAMRNLNPVMDLDLVIGGLIAVVIGGLGSFRGAVLGALILGLSESFGAQLMPGFSKFTVYIVMVGILLWRPEGLVKGV